MIKGVVKGQSLSVATPTIASDTIKYLYAEFEFSSDWDGLKKFCHFAKGDTVFDVVLDDNDKIERTVGLVLDTGLWHLYVHGNLIVDGEVEERITTTISTFKVVNTGVLNGEPFPDVTPSIGEQFVAQASKYADDAKESASNAKTSADNAKVSEDNASASEKHSVELEKDVAELASRAEQSAESAKTSESNALKYAQDAEISAEKAEQCASYNGYIGFDITDGGDLIYIRTENVDIHFNLNTNGELEVLI